MFGGGGGRSRPRQPTNQIAPGAGVVDQLSSGDRKAAACSIVGRVNIPSARVQPGGLAAQRHCQFGRAGTSGGGGGDRRRTTSVDRRSRTVRPGATTGTDSAFGGGGATQQSGAILPGVRITADAVNNTLLIYANQESYSIIEQTLRQLDRPQLQVSIDATIAEITLNDNLSYGVQFFLQEPRHRRTTPTRAPG